MAKLFDWDDVKPSKPFRYRRDAKGRWSCSQTWTAPRGLWEQSLKDTFTRGTRITELHSLLHNYWRFLKLETVELGDFEGPTVEIICDFAGFNEQDFETGREVVYTLTGTRVERSIFQHPLFLSEVIKADRKIIIAAAKGVYAERPDQSQEFAPVLYHVPTAGQESDQTITDENSLKWFIAIVREGNDTYMAPTLEWTRETVNLSGLTEAEVEKLGLVDDPPGNPVEPFHGKREWMKSACSEVRQEGAVETSESWELSPPGGFPFWYDYDPDTIKEHEADGSDP